MTETTEGKSARNALGMALADLVADLDEAMENGDDDWAARLRLDIVDANIEAFAIAARDATAQLVDSAARVRQAEREVARLETALLMARQTLVEEQRRHETARPALLDRRDATRQLFQWARATAIGAVCGRTGQWRMSQRGYVVSRDGRTTLATELPRNLRAALTPPATSNQ